MERSNLDFKRIKPENPIPARSKQAIKDLLDLTGYYTASLDDDWLLKKGANLKSLPKGVQALPKYPTHKSYPEGIHGLAKGVSYTKAVFDVRGLIQLAGKQANKETGIDFPKAVKGIKVNFKGTKIHFLQGTGWDVDVDTKIGEYIINYEDGQSRSIPIVYDRSVKDWWIKKGDPIPTDADIAWIGANEAAKKQGFDIQLYRYTVNNPLPDLEIKTIDFVSEFTDSSPFLLAITVEPSETVYEYFDSLSVYNDIIPRGDEATPDQIDLSDYYNASPDDDWHQHAGHDLHDLPRGLQVFGGVTFDVRGIIQLASGTESLRKTGLALPEEIKGIKVNRKGRSVSFLHSCGWQSDLGTTIGKYIIHYANGEVREIPLIYGKNIVDWWAYPEDEKFEEAEEVWTGSNAATDRLNQRTRLFKYTWENPLPDVEITIIDIISTLSYSGPFLIAITIGQ